MQDRREEDAGHDVTSSARCRSNPTDTQGTLKEKLAGVRRGPSDARGDRSSPARARCRNAAGRIARHLHRTVEKKDASDRLTASAAQIERMTRAYYPWPVARTRLGGDEFSSGAPRSRTKTEAATLPHDRERQAEPRRPVRRRKTQARRVASARAKKNFRGRFPSRNAWKPDRDSAHERRTKKARSARERARELMKVSHRGCGGRDSLSRSIRSQPMTTFC